MDPSHSSLKPKRSSGLRKKLDKLIGRSPSGSPSQPATNRPWAGLGRALRALQTNARLFPPLQSAIGAFIPALDVLEEAARNRREYEELASELTSLAELLTEHMKRSSGARMSDSVANVARSIEEQAKLIEERRSRGIGRRLAEADADLEELTQCYRRIEALFRQLQADANLSIWDIINDQMANTRLDRLNPIKLARYDSTSQGTSRRTCTANTRTAILSGLNDWSSDPNGADLYWMNGMAGTGKTTIACSFSESLEERKQLAASFFCAHTDSECRKVGHIIPTIAYQLARYSFPFQSALCEALGEDPDAGSKNLTKQFERLLKNPLLKVKEAIPTNLVVVIDALDECDDMREVEHLLALLLKPAVDVPIRFFVTSRPEQEIYSRMLARASGSRATLHLHEVEGSLVQADIEVYLKEELEFMSPPAIQIKELARRAGNLFIYAATLVRYIRSRKPQTDPQRRLQAVLDMTSESTRQYATIDELYSNVLKAALDPEELETEEVDDVRSVLRTAICVEEPVSVEVLAVLAGINDERRVLSALQPLRSVLHVSETTGLVSTLHASFPDYMFDETRSKAFSCSLAERSRVLAQRCFEEMKAELAFNICKLESSFVPDAEVDNLEERIKQAISPALWYACRHWGDHLRHAVYSDTLCATLNEFLSDRLLFWMEVLNLRQEIDIGAEVLLRAKLWLKHQIGAVPSDIARLTEDARNFVTRFAANPVSQSTPHIYISSLPFWSKSSAVYKRYWAKTRGLMNVTGGAMQRRDGTVLASWEVESGVSSVAYSPDGSYLAVGGLDGTVSVRSARNGTLVVGLFKGHTEAVLSVAYSPDGTRIISGSIDCTIRVWGAHDGTVLAGPFKGHTEAVLSVAYSPDGTCIVSGSRDGTIRVWGAQDGALIAGPLEEHTESVNSVAFSPDGTHIVSGSFDCTIRVWSSHDGILVAGPFEGHTGPVTSVAYSPDGTSIASGSGDCTIRVWSSHDGIPVADPFKGHTGLVSSVTYSPDGTRIASDSADGTIRVWSAHDGRPVAGPLGFGGNTGWVYSVAYSPDGTRIVSGYRGDTIRVWSAHDSILAADPDPFEGHTHWVISVAYSPDGTRIVSGSRDGAIRVWGAHNGTLLAGPFKGHTDSVNLVAYSPDGTRFVSGSNDGTIRVWSVHDGTLVASPFEGHTGSVCSVAYSPDGTRIISGSNDETIRVWGAHDGRLIAGPLEGHVGSVNSVAYSPDGTRIVSGSFDRTIRVWGARDGIPVADPFEGHTDSVNSAAFSPDGTHIVSGSFDCTIRVWRSDDGTLVAGPFEGHVGSVNSVAYSPDGTCIVSGSDDRTIRVWGAHDGIPVAGPFEGHTGSVNSVAFSPDGTHIISGSDDYAIRVWRLIVSSPINIQPTHTPGDTAFVSPSLSGSPLLTYASASPDATHPPQQNIFLDQCLNIGGWIQTADAQLLFWLSSEFPLSSLSPTSFNPLIIGSNDCLHIDSSGAFLDENWDMIYRLE